MSRSEESFRLATALVTGASGFIGMQTSRLLSERGVSVHALMRTESVGPWEKTSLVDIGTEEIPGEAMQQVDTVFHAAAAVHASPAGQDAERAFEQVNVEGTRRVISAAARAGVKGLVFFSSVKAMGEGGDECMNESWPEAPQTVYGRSKLEAERLVTDLGSRHGLHTVILRLPLVYGPGGKGNLTQMLGAVARGRFPPLPDLANRRSMVHVTDVAKAAMLAAGSRMASGKTYIVTDGAVYSTRQIYVLMCRALGKRVPFWTVPVSVLRGIAALGDHIGRTAGRPFVFDSSALKKLLGSAWYSSAKIERELGFEPSMHLEQALPAMVAALGRAPRSRVCA